MPLQKAAAVGDLHFSGQPSIFCHHDRGINALTVVKKTSLTVTR